MRLRLSISNICGAGHADQTISIKVNHLRSYLTVTDFFVLYRETNKCERGDTRPLYAGQKKNVIINLLDTSYFYMGHAHQ